MDTNALFDEFKKNKSQQDEKLKKELDKISDEEITEPESHEDIDEIPEEVVEEETKKSDDNDKDNETIVDMAYTNPKFKEFKQEFLKNEKNKTLMIFFNQMREDGNKLFDDDFFIYQKMLDKNIKVIMLEPSIDDIALGKKNRFFLVRPIYPNEYQSFIIQFQSKEKHPDEYMKFIIETGVLYPNEKKEHYNLAYTSGEALTLFDTIVNISDLNKRYRVIEV